MFGIERQPFGSDLRHEFSLGFLAAMNGSFTTAGPRSRSKKAGHPNARILTSTIGRHNEGRRPMLRTILTATALLCLSQAAFSAGDDRRTAQRLHGRLREILQRRHPGRRTHHRLPRQGERQDHAGLQEGAGGRRRNEGTAGVHAGRRPKRDRRAGTPGPASAEPCEETFKKKLSKPEHQPVHSPGDQHARSF